MSRRTERGFTIVELLVVITIIGILMALLFPAINAARDHARRTNCINNQRQVGTAIITAATTNGNFPKHLRQYAPPAATPLWPWTASILPNVGRTDIYDAAVANSGTLGSQRIDVFICPSDPPAAPATPQLSYVVNGGLPNTGANDAGDAVANGIFFAKLDQSLSYVAQGDGVSNTLLLSENIHAGNWNDSASEFQQTALWQSGGTPANTATLTSLYVGTATPSNATAVPSSRHSGGFVVTFCDNRTRFLSGEMRYDVYKLIMTPKGASATEAQTTPLDESMLK